MKLAEALQQAYPGIRIGPTKAEADVILYADTIAYWGRPEQKPLEADVLAAYNPLIDAKAARIAAGRAECSRRIFERYPAGRQLSALAGLYDPANVATMTDWIAACIAAENAAADAIEAAATVQAGEAVTVAGPV